MLIGEAPGLEEDKTGLPFQGAAGKLLRRALADAGLQDIYITNVNKCKPELNRTPTNVEVAACLPYLSEEIEAIRPKVIILLGASALKAVTGKTGIKQARGMKLTASRQWRISEDTYIMATYHPAAYLHSHNQTILSALEEDLKRVAGMIGASMTDLPEHRISYLYEHVSDATFDAALAQLKDCDVLAADCEWTALQDRKIGWPWSKGAELYSLALSGWMPDGSIRSVAISYPRHTNEQTFALQEFIKSKRLIFHNAMADLIWLQLTGLHVELAGDTMLLAYLLDEEQPLSLAALGTTVAGITTEWKQPLWSSRPTAQPEWKELLRYNCRDTYVTLLVAQGLQKQLKQRTPQEQKGIVQILKQVLLPSIPAFVDMAHNGVPMDAKALSRAIDAQREELEIRGQSLAMSINSDRLEDGIKLATSSTRTKSFLQREYGLELTSSKADELHPYATEYPVIGTILAVRHHTKLLGTYLEPWKELLDEQKEDRLHSVYRLGSVRTGRTSAELEKGGSLQLIPRGRGTDERWIRQLISAPEGKLILSADQSQIELRIAAWIAKEENLINAFRRGDDIHRLMAAAVRGCSPSEVDAESRQRAKAVVFGRLFGMGDDKFIKYARAQFGITFDLAEAHRQGQIFFNLFPGLKSWHRRCESDVRRGYTVTPLGRHRHGITELTKAINSPVQSTASDILLRSLIQLREAFTGEPVELIGTVHDSVLLLIPDDGDSVGYVAFVKAIMEDPDLTPFSLKELPVPLKVDIKVGKTWGG